MASLPCNIAKDRPQFRAVTALAVPSTRLHGKQPLCSSHSIKSPRLLRSTLHHRQRGPPPCSAEGTEDPEPSNSLMTPEFQQIFKAAMERQQAALDKYSGDGAPSAPAPEAPQVSPLEEVLYALMADSRRTLLQLERQRDSIKSALEREKRQFERMHFVLRKARADAAYIKVLERQERKSKSP